MLREEILAVIAKHITVDRDKVQVKLDRGDPVSTLEIDIEMPSAAAAAPAPAGCTAGDGWRLIAAFVVAVSHQSAACDTVSSHATCRD